MKNLLHCHTKNVHSFPLSYQDGLYKRIFVATEIHNLWRSCEIAIHPHHVDLKITVLEGVLHNSLFRVVNDEGYRYVDRFKKYKWNSHILNGSGGFEFIGEEDLQLLDYVGYEPFESFTMKACELHTVKVEQNKKCVWMVEEFKPSCEYSGFNYSRHDLTEWKPDGLYIEVDDSVAEEYIGKYRKVLNI